MVRPLREEEGKDIWLFGGGSLFRSIAKEGLVDTVEVGVVPIVLGRGIPRVAEPSGQIELALKEHKVYEKTGSLFLIHDVNNAGQP